MPKKKILIADDSEFIRLVLKEYLSKEYTCITAGTGKKTIERYKKEKPDLVLLDIVMPGGEEEGIEVLKKIMKTKPKTSVIMISAVGQDAIIEECKKAGAKDYITKPFDKEKVIKTVAKYSG